MKRLFWDIETSPDILYSWRTGRKITLTTDNILEERKVICICYKWEGEEKVHSMSWDWWDDRRLITDFAEVIREADELVAHNGDRFDLRWYQGRHLIHNLGPLPISKTVDTLKIARKHFYLNSNRLDYLAKKLFNRGKIHTDYNLWKRVCGQDVMDVLAIKAGRGDKAALGEMIDYCKMDAALVEDVWNRMSDYESPKTHVGVLDGLPRWTCPHCGSKNVALDKTRPTAKGVIQKQMKCKEDGRYFTIANKVYKDYLVAKEEESG